MIVNKSLELYLCGIDTSSYNKKGQKLPALFYNIK